MNAKGDDVSAVVFDVEHGSFRDGPGIRTVVFVKGCPLRCRWCHNPESWEFAPQTYSDGEVCGRVRTVADVLEEVLRDRPFYENSGGGLTVSGGEPLASPDFTLALLKAAKGAGLDTAVETSGAVPMSVVEAAAPFVDTWLYDIKTLDAEKFRGFTGGDLSLVLSNLDRLDALGAKVVLRHPNVPGLTDGHADLAALDRLAARTGSVRDVEILPYHRLGVSKAERLGLSVFDMPAH